MVRCGGFRHFGEGYTQRESGVVVRVGDGVTSSLERPAQREAQLDHEPTSVAYVLAIVESGSVEVTGCHADGSRDDEIAVRTTLGQLTARASAAARHCGADIIVVGGAARERWAAVSELSALGRYSIVEVDVDRYTTGRVREALRAQAPAVALEHARAREVDALDRFRHELCQGHSAAVQGIRAVASALRRREAAVVFATSADLGGAWVWAVPGSPTELYDEEDAGPSGSRLVRADEAIPAAAQAAGAGYVTTPDCCLMDDVGALLRS